MTEQEQEVKSKINTLNEVIKQAKHDIDDIRKMCHHAKSTIQILDGGKHICKVCVVCEEVTGYPGPQELEDFLSQ